MEKTRPQRLLEVIEKLYQGKNSLFTTFDLIQFAKKNPDYIEHHFEESVPIFIVATKTIGLLTDSGDLVRLRGRRSTYAWQPRMGWIYGLPETNVSEAMFSSAILALGDSVPDLSHTVKANFKYCVQNIVDDKLTVDFCPLDISSEEFLQCDVNFLLEAVKKSFKEIYHPYYQLILNADLPVSLNKTENSPDREISSPVEASASSFNILETALNNCVSLDKQAINLLVQITLEEQSKKDGLVELALSCDRVAKTAKDKIINRVCFYRDYHKLDEKLVWKRLFDAQKQKDGMDIYSTFLRHQSIYRTPLFESSLGQSSYVDAVERLGFLPSLTSVAESVLPIEKHDNPLIEELRAIWNQAIKNN